MLVTDSVLSYCFRKRSDPHQGSHIIDAVAILLLELE